MKPLVMLVVLALCPCISASAQARTTEVAGPSNAVSQSARVEPAQYKSFAVLLLSPETPLASDPTAAQRPHAVTTLPHGTLAPVEFIVKDAMVFFRIPNLAVLMPMSGGGASGCFDPDGVQRGYTQDELIKAMIPLDPVRPSQ